MIPILKKYKISLKFKIAFAFILLVLAMMSTVTYIFAYRENRSRLEQVKLRMERLANNIATIRAVETTDWAVYQDYIDNQLKLNPDLVYIAIFDELGILKAQALNAEWLDLGGDHKLERWEQAEIILQLDRRQIAAESQFDLETKAVNILVGERNLGTVKVGFSLIELNNSLQHHLYRNLQIGAIFTLLAILVAIFLSYNIVVPLEKLTTAMSKIAEGDLNQQLPILTHDEIGELAQTFNSMTIGLQEKELIEQFSHSLSFSVELEKLVRLILEQINPALNANYSLLFLADKTKPTDFRLIAAVPENYELDLVLTLPLELYESLLMTNTPLALGALHQQLTFSSALQAAKLYHPQALITPVVIKEEIIGFSVVSPPPDQRPYHPGEIKFLRTLMTQAGFAIENAILLAELTEQERLKQEFEIAARVQQSLLPQQIPKVDGLDIDGICIPTAEIGGDYFDYYQLNAHTIGVAIADVTGKGTSAAFYMAVVKGIMLALTPIFHSPKQLLCELNRRLFGHVDRRIFITMIYAIFDSQRQQLTFARAGHNALIMGNPHQGTFRLLTPNGIGLGLAHNDLFDDLITEEQIRFQAGDAFLFYTDGISEAMNTQREEFGEDRLLQTFLQTNPPCSSKIRETVIDAVQRFVNGAPQHDDITMVTVTTMDE
ncbi:SpoIIE family protein phosphatase [candidate division KSB1 bacterium]|nr:SpoIIE family protein phosphatase [candidate division KSB1 bacterium]